MTKNFAPSGATASACLSDLISIDRKRLLEIIGTLETLDINETLNSIDALKDTIALNDLTGGYISCGAAVKVDDHGYITVNAPNLDLLETATAAVRSAINADDEEIIEDDETAFWLDIDRQIYAGWSSVKTADIATRLRLERLNVELLIAVRDQTDHEDYQEERELKQILINEKKLELLALLQKLSADPAAHDGPTESANSSGFRP